MNQPSPSDRYKIEAKLMRFEERFAVLAVGGGAIADASQTESQLEIRWPIKNLPENIRLGDTVYLKIKTQKMEEDEKYTRMRRLLEELIN